MESTKSRNDDGSQNVDYYKSYYQKNKEKIKAQNKKRYEEKRQTVEGLQSHRETSLMHTRAYRERYPEKIKEQRKRQHTSRKKKAMAIVGSLVCENCGCNQIDFLEFNHKNGNGCKEHKENRSAMMDMILTHSRSTADLNILCRVCNALDYLTRKNSDESRRFTILWD